MELSRGILLCVGDGAGCSAMYVAAEGHSRGSIRLQLGKIDQRLITAVVAHFSAGLQAAADFGPQRRMKYSTAQLLVQMDATGIGRFAVGHTRDRAGNRRCDTAGTTVGTAVHLRSYGG